MKYLEIPEISDFSDLHTQPDGLYFCQRDLTFYYVDCSIPKMIYNCNEFIPGEPEVIHSGISENLLLKAIAIGKDSKHAKDLIKD